MRKQTHDFPDAKLVLVCHSHGGNVALHALQDEELRGAVAGVVCLATPFLIAARRELDDEDFDYIGLAATLLLLAMAGVVFVPLFMAGVGPLVGGWVSVAVVGVLLAIAVIDRLLRFAGARFVAKIASGVVDRLLRFAAKMVQQMALARMDPARLLIIRSPGDEASSTLAAAPNFSALARPGSTSGARRASCTWRSGSAGCRAGSPVPWSSWVPFR